MTFEPSAISLENEHLNDLAQLIHETGIEVIDFSGAEIKSLFTLDTPAKDLTEFEWNLTGSFISGKNDNASQIFSPNLLLSEPIPKNTWFDYAQTAAILNYIRNRLGDDALLNKIQLTLSEDFDYLSQGQAKSAIKRYLGLSLSSAERNDIYRLRKKIEGYWKLITAFEDKLAVNRTRPQAYIDQDRTKKELSDDELITKTTDRLAFMCWECKKHIPFPDSEPIMSPPTHHDRPMVLNWNVKAEPDELTDTYQELEDTLANIDSVLQPVDKSSREPSTPPEGFPKLYCQVCREYQEISDELQRRLDQSDHRIELPKHHNEEMQIVTRPISHLSKLRQIAEKYKLIESDREPGLYYVCTTCLLLLSTEELDEDQVNDVDAPIHHNQRMKPMRIPEKTDNE